MNPVQVLRSVLVGVVGLSWLLVSFPFGLHLGLSLLSAVVLAVAWKLD